MLDIAKVYRNTIYVYVSRDKRYEYNVAVQSEPEKKSRLVVVTIYDHKYQYGDKSHQPKSCLVYTCYNYRFDSMLRRVQVLFDGSGLIRNNICSFTYLSDTKCPAKEK